MTRHLELITSREGVYPLLNTASVCARMEGHPGYVTIFVRENGADSEFIVERHKEIQFQMKTNKKSRSVGKRCTIRDITIYMKLFITDLFTQM